MGKTSVTIRRHSVSTLENSFSSLKLEAPVNELDGAGTDGLHSPRLSFNNLRRSATCIVKEKRSRGTFPTSNKSSSVTDLNSSNVSIGSVSGISINSLDLSAPLEVTPRQKEILLHSWKLAVSREKAKNATPVSSLFDSVYAKFFEKCPEAKAMFSNHIRQALMLSTAIARMLQNLDDPPKFHAHMRELAGTHVAMGVTEEMFMGLGDSLMEGLEMRLGEDWTVEIYDSWSMVYRMASQSLQVSMENMKNNPKLVMQWVASTLGPRKSQLITTWEAVSQEPELFAAKFYGAFFKRIPEAKLCFKNKMDREKTANSQYRAMVGALGHLVRGIDRPDKLDYEVKHLARVHMNLGITRLMCEEFCRTLVATLKDHLGKDFSKEDEAAWSKALGLVATAMATMIETAESNKNIQCTIS